MWLLLENPIIYRNSKSDDVTFSLINCHSFFCGTKAD